jgi:hypothetical protein
MKTNARFLNEAKMLDAKMADLPKDHRMWGRGQTAVLLESQRLVNEQPGWLPQKYRRKCEATAERWYPGKAVAGVHEAGPDSDGVVYGFVSTSMGTLRLASGDWLVTESDGERFPWKPHLFEQAFEPAVDTTPAPPAAGG